MKWRLRIREVAERKGISMTKLHYKSEISYNTIRKLTREPESDTSLSTLFRIAEVLGCSVHDLIEEVRDKDNDN